MFISLIFAPFGSGEQQDTLLCRAVQRYRGKNWKKIAESFPDRTNVQCLHRWQKVLNPELVKGPWSKEEDAKIIELVNKYGPTKWSTISSELPGRIGKQCRESVAGAASPLQVNAKEIGPGLTPPPSNKSRHSVSQIMTTNLMLVVKEDDIEGAQQKKL